MKSFDQLMASRDPLSLMSAQDAEKNPRVQELMKTFQARLPNHFGQVRLILSPVGNLDHVLRADCSHAECRVRASVHIRRQGGVGLLEFVETTENGQPRVSFDRSEKPCSDCQATIG